MIEAWGELLVKLTAYLWIGLLLHQLSRAEARPAQRRKSRTVEWFMVGVLTTCAVVVFVIQVVKP